jgi:hypothetical protein
LGKRATGEEKSSMPNNTKPVPEGFHTATPYLICGDAAAAIAFYSGLR